MIQYEYKVVTKTFFIEKMLNKLAKEGWELIVVTGASSGRLLGTGGHDARYIFRRIIKNG